MCAKKRRLISRRRSPFDIDMSNGLFWHYGVADRQIMDIVIVSVSGGGCRTFLKNDQLQRRRLAADG